MNTKKRFTKRIIALFLALTLFAGVNIPALHSKASVWYSCLKGSDAGDSNASFTAVNGGIIKNMAKEYTAGNLFDNIIFQLYYAQKPCLYIGTTDIFMINFEKLNMKRPMIEIIGRGNDFCNIDSSRSDQNDDASLGFFLTDTEIGDTLFTGSVSSIINRDNVFSNLWDTCQTNDDAYYAADESVVKKYQNALSKPTLWEIRLVDADAASHNDCYYFYVADPGLCGASSPYCMSTSADSPEPTETPSNIEGGGSGSSSESTEESTETVEDLLSVPSIYYMVHRQTYGWEDEWKQDGQTSGTMGESKRLEGIIIRLNTELDLGVEYRTHIQTYGWETSWKKNGAMSGTSGESKRLEAIQIRLTGDDASDYHIWYRVHAQNYGWLGWARDGAPSGTAGQGKRLEAIEIMILPQDKVPTSGIYGGTSFIDVAQNPTLSASDCMVQYMTHVQSYGDQAYVGDGSVSGTFGESKRLEGIRIKINKDNAGIGSISGGIEYSTHVQTYGWLADSHDGEFNGTYGESKRLEAIRIRLTGDLQKNFDVYYRVHAQTYGWLGWAKNGAPAGTSGLSKRLEAIQIVVVPKGTDAPNPLPADPPTPAYLNESDVEG